MFARACVRADERILRVAEAEEVTVVHPLRLNELELPAEVCTDEGEHQPAVLAVVFQHALVQRRTIRSAAADHAMQPDHARDGCVARVARRVWQPGGVL